MIVLGWGARFTKARASENAGKANQHAQNSGKCLTNLSLPYSPRSGFLALSGPFRTYYIFSFSWVPQQQLPLQQRGGRRARGGRGGGCRHGLAVNNSEAKIG